jgi:membrane-associated phospholipid phosphatase
LFMFLMILFTKLNGKSLLKYIIYSLFREIVLKNRIALSLLILTFSFNIEIFSQENLSVDTIHTSVFQDFNHGINDGIRLLNAPAGFKSKDWIILGGIVGVTTGSFFIDKSIRESVAKNHTATMDNITGLGHYYGNAAYMVILSGATYLTGKIIRNNEIAGTGRMILETLAYAGIITTVLKVGLGRARPYTDKGAFDFFNLSIKNDYLSMPSGHTTVAFAVSSVLTAKIKNMYASIALYSLAGLTMYQRIYSDSHWFSDTFLGAAISTVIGNAIVKYNESENGDDGTLIILPSMQEHSVGLSLVYSF